MKDFIKTQLAPNRLAVYFTALAALGTGLLGVLGNLSFQSTAAVVGSLVVLAGVVARWLAGWQNYEKAMYQDNLHASAMAREAALVAERGAPRPSRVNLPR